MKATRLLLLLTLAILAVLALAACDFTGDSGSSATTALTTTEAPVTTLPTTPSEGLAFTSNGDGTCDVSGIGSCTDTYLVIPKTSPDGDRVTGIGESAFLGCTSLWGVTIPDTITSIGFIAFADCTSLRGVTIPNSVTLIEVGAFSGCSSLESILVAPGNPTYHSDENCLIETEAKLLIAGSANSIIPSDGSVTEIGEYAFAGCISLGGVTIPNCVTRIGIGAFKGCASFESITIPHGVTSIGQDVLSGCVSLESILVAPGNPTYHSNGNCLIETEAKLLLAGCKNSIIPNDGSVTEIGDVAFWGCTSLRGVTIPNSVTSIGSGAFLGCTSLEDVTIGNSVTWIGSGAFLGCTSLTSVIIPKSVTSIGTPLLPDGFLSLFGGTFSGCTNLDTIYYEGTEAEWAAIKKESGYKPDSCTVVCGYGS